MNKTLIIRFGLSLALVAPAIVTAAAEMPRRLTRAQSFLGIHYDFHAGKDCTEIGKNTTREMIENIINQVRPDYILILPWNLKTEIMEQLAYTREWGAQFIVPIPEAAVL